MRTSYVFYLNTLLYHTLTLLQENAAEETICHKMPKPKDQNIFASFQAWCQQNTQGLQIGLSIFNHLSRPGDIVILLGFTGYPEDMMNS